MCLAHQTCHSLSPQKRPENTQLASDRPGILTLTPGLGGCLPEWTEYDQFFVTALKGLPPLTSFHHSDLYTLLVFPPPGILFTPELPPKSDLKNVSVQESQQPLHLSFLLFPDPSVLHQSGSLNT